MPPPRGAGGPLPTYVYVHGGDNVAGYPSLRATLAARAGVVVVALPYRLGPLGFLPLDAPATGGGYVTNAAMRDLVLGLEWVRDNAAAFGGDPTRVTVGGQSAGAVNIITLLAVPAAQGLFSQWFMESGAIGGWRASYALPAGAHFTDAANCKGPPPAVLACLRAASTEALKAASATLATPLTASYVGDDVLPRAPGRVLLEGGGAVNVTAALVFTRGGRATTSCRAPSSPTAPWTMPRRTRCSPA